MSRKLFEIAKEIHNDWKPIHPTARPYWEAMTCLNSIYENYYADSGRSVVVYFLSNAATWRGETAKRIKKELKEILTPSPWRK